MKNNNNLKKKPIIILGAGRHSKILIKILKECNYEILGVTDPFKKIGEDYFGTKILGSDEVIFEYSINDIELVNGIAELDNRKTRYSLSKKLEAQGYKFANVIHPSVIISDEVKLNNGVQLMAGAIIQHGVEIGFCSIINSGAIIDHDCKISEFCHIAPGATLSGNVTIGSQSHIGTGVTIIEKKRIGENCIIGAGSIIYKDIPSNTKYIQPKKNISTLLT